MLTRIFTVTLSLHYLQSKPPTQKQKPSQPNPTRTEQNKLAEQQLEIFLLDLFQLIVAHAIKILQVSSTSQNTSNTSTSITMNPPLFPIKIMLKWIFSGRLHSITVEPKIYEQIAEFSSLLASFIMTRHFQIWRVVYDNLYARQVQKKKSGVGKWEKVPVLKEDLELRGFLPLEYDEEEDEGEVEKGWEEVQLWVGIKCLRVVIVEAEKDDPKVYMSMNDPIIVFSTKPIVADEVVESEWTSGNVVGDIEENIIGDEVNTIAFLGLENQEDSRNVLEEGFQILGVSGLGIPQRVPELKDFVNGPVIPWAN
ncbi:hypothetical protein HK098_007749 [Nowakowskiella sp. JEL0407]|nr:hypothetical protein HK098_007749 [Nowakowskiella sp. JEL0407]